MDGCRFKPISLNDPGCGPNLDARLKPPPEIVLNVIRRDIANRPLAKRLLKVRGRTFVRFVGLFCADW
jgi:hypothetical protein